MTQPDSSDATSPGAVTALVVEDERQLLDEMVEDMEDQGYRVLAAENGEQALAILDKQHPDIIISDIKMPKMDGYELQRRIRADHPHLSSVPFVFLSSYATSQEIITGKKSGADDYITKPINYEHFYATIETRLREVRRITSPFNAQIEEARRQIRDLKASEDAFIERAEAQLRTPLTGIIGYTEALLADLFGPIENATQRTYLEMIQRNARDLLERVPQIGTLARLGRTDAQRVETEAVSPRPLVNEVIDRCQYHMQQRDVSAQLDLDHAELVHADAEKLEEALFHTVFCALGAAEEGAALIITAREAFEGTGTLTIAVSPTRGDMSDLPGRLEKIAGANASELAGRETEAIALFQARALVELQGGRYQAGFEPGTRTLQFSIELPSAADGETEQPLRAAG
jgi:CheY-like chemotaxis protein